MWHKLKGMTMVLLLVMIVVVMPQLAHAQTYFSTSTGTLGDQNSNNDYRVTATNDGVIHFAFDTGITYPYTNYTTPNTPVTLTAAQSGLMVTDMGNGTGPTTVGSCSKWTLPAAVPGLEYSFSTGSKCFMTVDTASTSDTILYSITGTGQAGGDSIKSTGQAGDSVTLFSTATGKWSVKAMKSTWTNNTTN